MERQTKATEDAANAAVDGAKATFKNVELVKDAERAWIEVRLRNVSPADHEIMLTNCARTMAKIKDFSLIPKLSPITQVLPDTIRRDDFQTSTTISCTRLPVPSDEPWIVGSLNLGNLLGKDALADVWNNRRGFSCYVIVRYEDISGESHETECFYYFGSGKRLFRVQASI